jgi:hypothetical protein
MKSPSPQCRRAYELGALGGTRTPNLLIRSQMLYPLSYERGCLVSLRHSGCALRQHVALHSPAAAQVAVTNADMSSTHLAQTRRCFRMAGSRLTDVGPCPVARPRPKTCDERLSHLSALPIGSLDARQATLDHELHRRVHVNRDDSLVGMGRRPDP